MIYFSKGISVISLFFTFLLPVTGQLHGSQNILKSNPILLNIDEFENTKLFARKQHYFPRSSFQVVRLPDLQSLKLLGSVEENDVSGISKHFKSKTTCPFILIKKLRKIK